MTAAPASPGASCRPPAHAHPGPRWQRGWRVSEGARVENAFGVRISSASQGRRSHPGARLDERPTALATARRSEPAETGSASGACANLAGSQARSPPSPSPPPQCRRHRRCRDPSGAHRCACASVSVAPRRPLHELCHQFRSCSLSVRRRHGFRHGSRHHDRRCRCRCDCGQKGLLGRRRPRRTSRSPRLHLHSRVQMRLRLRLRLRPRLGSERLYGLPCATQGSTDQRLTLQRLAIARLRWQPQALCPRSASGTDSLYCTPSLRRTVATSPLRD